MIDKKFYAPDKESLRKWLSENHKTSQGVWVVYDKKSSGKRTLSYDEIVEELLCFGWVDSLPRSQSDTQAMYYISPRKQKSPWSKINKLRIGKLIEEERMTQAGLDIVERSKKDGSWTSYDAIENLTIPVELKLALSKNTKAQHNFDQFSISNKKQILWYITNAKQEQTKKRRIDQIVKGAENNINPLEYRKNKK